MFSKDSAKYIAEIDAKMIEQQNEAYALETCPISGKALDSKGEPLDIVVANRQVKLCCGGCEASARSDVAATIAKLDEAVIAAQSENYEYTTCPISGKELGSHGDAVNLVVANRLIKVCCADCNDPVLADPIAAFNKLKAESGD